MTMRPEERYQNDSVFRNLVDLLRHMLEENAMRVYTPTELREAVILAACMYESQHIKPLFIECGTGTPLRSVMLPKEVW